MDKILDLLASRRFWAALVALIFIVAGSFGVELGEENAWIESMVSIGSMVAIAITWMISETVRPANRRIRNEPK